MEYVVFTAFVEMKRGLNLEPSPLILHTPKPCTTSTHFTSGQKSFLGSYQYVSAGLGRSLKKG